MTGLAILGVSLAGMPASTTHVVASSVMCNRRDVLSESAADKVVRSGKNGHCVGDNHSDSSGNWRSGVLGGAVGFIIKPPKYFFGKAFLFI